MFLGMFNATIAGSIPSGDMPFNCQVLGAAQEGSLPQHLMRIG